MFGSILGFIVLVFVLALTLSYLIFLLMKLLYNFVLKNRNEPTKSFDRLYLISFIFAIFLSGFIIISDLSNSASLQNTHNKKTAKPYNEYPAYEPPPTFDFEPIPTFDFDSFNVTETPTITIESASIDFIHYPAIAHRNEEVTVKICGKPYTTYSITVTYSSGVSEAEGLYPKGSNSDGYVSWTWKVGGRTSFGTYPITVSGGGISETIYFRVVS